MAFTEYFHHPQIFRKNLYKKACFKEFWVKLVDFKVIFGCCLVIYLFFLFLSHNFGCPEDNNYLLLATHPIRGIYLILAFGLLWWPTSF